MPIIKTGIIKIKKKFSINYGFLFNYSLVSTNPQIRHWELMCQSNTVVRS